MPTKPIKISSTLEEGARFSCKMCGDCCRGFNDGDVFLYGEDITKLASFLGFDGNSGLRKFSKKYLKIIQTTFYWRKEGAKRGKNYSIGCIGFQFQGEDEHCAFLSSENACTVHEARPLQCRSFPWWQKMVRSRNQIWKYARKCPGLKDLNSSDAKFYSREEIRSWAKREQEAELKHFLKLKENDFDIFRAYPFLSKDLLLDEKD